MKKSTIRAVSLAIAASLCVTGASWAFDHTHPTGVLDIKVKNMSHSTLRVVQGCDCQKPVHTFGPQEVSFMTKENTFAHAKKLGFGDKASYVVKYDFDKHIIPNGHWGSLVTLKKLVKGKDGCYHYSRCIIGLMGGPGKPMFGKHGALCKHVDITSSSGSGSTSYLKVTYQ